MGEEQNTQGEQEKISDINSENTPVTEEIFTETLKDNTTTNISQIENMEVHHHPDIHCKKKNGKNIFLNL
jgi:hypothetical protein